MLRPPAVPWVGFVVVPRSTEVQAAEATMDLALLVLVGGTRPAVSTAMVSAYLLERFDIACDNAEVCRHEPEDFIVRFRLRVDRDRVLAAPPTAMPLPLLWRLWRRTAWASAGSFRFRVLVGMRRIPPHVRSAETAQIILGPSCAEVDVVHPSDVPGDDGREFFVTAWCANPQFIPDEEVLFVPEPRLMTPEVAASTVLTGLRYLVRIRLVAFQDWSSPPASPVGHGGNAEDGDDGGNDGDGHGGANGGDGDHAPAGGGWFG